MIDVAVLKATYTREAGAAKQTIRYIQNRAGRDGAKITRTLWSWDGKLERSEAYHLIDEAEKRSYFYRLVINPDPVKEDTHKDLYLRTLIEKAMRGLEDRLGKHVQWIAATHADHTPLRHVHVVAILPKKLQVEDLQAVRGIATAAAFDQRRERDSVLALQSQRERGNEAQWELQR